MTKSLTMTDTAELIARLRRMPNVQMPVPGYDRIVIEAADALAAQAQEIERKDEMLGACNEAMNYLEEWQRRAPRLPKPA